jgi:hypothetical protein
MAIGVNILGDFSKSFELARDNNIIKFIQIDAISGDYENGSIDYTLYNYLKQESNALVMGGGLAKIL